jgi:hypothetical protein
MFPCADGRQQFGTAERNGGTEKQFVRAFIGTERITLDRINGRLLFTSNQVQIDNLTAFLGGGRVVAEGGALLKGLELQRFRFSVNARNFTAPVPPDFTTSGDAQIEISGFRENGVLNTLIAGSIAARRAVYTKDIDLADFISRRRRKEI